MVETLGRGVVRITGESGQRIAYAVSTGGVRWVFLDGQTFVVDSAAPEGRERGGRHGPDALAAPMPATVTKVQVEPGQRVSAGDSLIVLEAMKMELQIKAPRDATVRSIACSVGELVQPGVPLLELE